MIGMIAQEVGALTGPASASTKSLVGLHFRAAISVPEVKTLQPASIHKDTTNTKNIRLLIVLYYYNSNCIYRLLIII